MYRSCHTFLESKLKFLGVQVESNVAFQTNGSYGLVTKRLYKALFPCIVCQTVFDI